MERDPIKAKACKVWNADRTIRKSCAVLDLESLRTEGKRKLDIDGTAVVRIVTEEDGTEVDDDDYFQLVPDFSTFLILREWEVWMPESGVKDPFEYSEMCCESGSLRRTVGGAAGSSCRDSVDGSSISVPSNRAAHLFDQLCSGNAYKQLLPWLLLRPVDLEEIVNADPEQLARHHPRDTVDAIQEMSHKALTDYNNAQKAVQMLSLYDQAVKHTGKSK